MSESAQVELIHHASVVRNDVSPARHSGVDKPPPWPICPPCPGSCSEQDSGAEAMAARHENAQNGLYISMPYPMKAREGAGMTKESSFNKVVGFILFSSSSDSFPVFLSPKLRPLLQNHI